MTIRILLLTFISFTTVADTRIHAEFACHGYFCEKQHCVERRVSLNNPAFRAHYDLCKKYASDAHVLYLELIHDYTNVSEEAIEAIVNCKPRFTRLIKKYSRKHREWNEKAFRIKYGQYEEITGLRLRLPTENEYEDAFQLASQSAGNDEDIEKSFASGVERVLSSISRNGCEDFDGGFLSLRFRGLGGEAATWDSRFCHDMVEQHALRPLPNKSNATKFEIVKTHACHALTGRLSQFYRDAKDKYKEEIEKKQWLRDRSFPKREQF
jgi:hypothetical protein